MLLRFNFFCVREVYDLSDVAVCFALEFVENPVELTQRAGKLSLYIK